MTHTSFMQFFFLMRSPFEEATRLRYHVLQFLYTDPTELRESERQRQRETERDKEREGAREREREGEREGERDTQRQRQRQRDRDREMYIIMRPMKTSVHADTVDSSNHING